MNDNGIASKAGFLISLVLEGELGDYIDRKQKERQTPESIPVDEAREKDAQLERDFKNLDHKFTYLIKDHSLAEKTDRDIPQSFIFNLTSLLDRYPQLTRQTRLTTPLNGEYVNIPYLRRKFQGIGASQTPSPTVEIKPPGTKPKQMPRDLASLMQDLADKHLVKAKPKPEAKKTLDRKASLPENVPENQPKKSHKPSKMPDAHTLILQYIANHGEVSRKQLEEAFKGVLGLKMIQRKLKALIDKGFIEATGNTTNRKYRLKKA